MPKTRKIKKTTVETWEVPDGVIIDELAPNAPDCEEEDGDIDDVDEAEAEAEDEDDDAE